MNITGQVQFDSHLAIAVEVAAELVNALATAAAYGRQRAIPTAGVEQREAALAALAAAAGGRNRDLTMGEAAQLAALAAQLRDVFVRIDTGDADAAAQQVNSLLMAVDARPRLHRHAGEPWHLHFHPIDAPIADGWTAACATSLAVVLGSEEAHRLGVCGAPTCERVYLDTTRNTSRRFCSTACQNRVKAATYRTRRAATGSTEPAPA